MQRVIRAPWAPCGPLGTRATSPTCPSCPMPASRSATTGRAVARRCSSSTAGPPTAPSGSARWSRCATGIWWSRSTCAATASRRTRARATRSAPWWRTSSTWCVRSACPASRWSMGGLLVLELAQRLGERVSALGLVCTTAGGLADAKNPLAETKRAADMKKAIAADFRAFVRDFAPQLFKDPHSPLLSWATGQMQKTPPHVAEACFDALLAADLRAGAKKLEVPTAVLHGKHDALLPLAHGEDLAKRIPGAKLTVFVQSGHAPHLEEPEAFNAALEKLLA